MDKSKRHLAWWVVGLLAVAAIVAWWLLRPAGVPEGFAVSNGRIEATEVDIASKIAGRIDTILVKEGQFVREGEVLAKMDTRVLQEQRLEAIAQIKEAQSAVAAAQALLEQRQSETRAAQSLVNQRQAELDSVAKRHTRSRSLAQRGAISAQQLDDDRAAAESARAALESAKAQVSASKAAIESFARSCALEFAAKGIRSNAILPGMVETPLVLNGTLSEEDLGRDKAKDLLKRYGDIVFTLQPCSADGNGGEICSITAQAAAANKQTVTISKDFKITGEGDAWTDAQETSEGPLKNLFDGSTASDNYFHMSWSASTPFPHYIVVDLKEETNFFSFTYTARDNANCDNPKEMDILVSKELVGSKPDYVNETGTTKLASLSELPGTRKASYMSDRISSDETFRYVWFKVLSATSGSNWIALSELALKQVTTTIYDPETGETVVVED